VSLWRSQEAGDYTTIECSSSVLKFSNGYVTGHINSWDGEIETMLWTDLQSQLIEKLMLPE
jgi:hypothetical protein